MTQEQQILDKAKRYAKPHERFLNNTIKTDCCWIWSKCTRQGYGAFQVDNKIMDSHRYSYEYHKGKIPKGMCVLHKCDNRRCVNPEHLFLGTRIDNQKDMKNKNRAALGEKNARSKLTLNDIKDIRKSKGIVKTGVLLDKYNISRSQMGRILRHENWNNPMQL